MNNAMTFCDRADFYFIVQYLAYRNIDINNCDDVDEMYNEINNEYNLFTASSHYSKSTSYLQAINDFLSQ